MVSSRFNSNVFIVGQYFSELYVDILNSFLPFLASNLRQKLLAMKSELTCPCWTKIFRVLLHFPRITWLVLDTCTADAAVHTSGTLGET